MENNGILAVYDAYGADSTENDKAAAKKYLGELDTFQSGAGKEYLEVENEILSALIKMYEVLGGMR